MSSKNKRKNSGGGSRRAPKGAMTMKQGGPKRVRSKAKHKNDPPKQPLLTAQAVGRMLVISAMVCLLVGALLVVNGNTMSFCLLGAGVAFGVVFVGQLIEKVYVYLMQ